MKIERPDTWCASYGAIEFYQWFDKHVEPINKMLAEGVELRSALNAPEEEFVVNSKEWWFGESAIGFARGTHKALLINIQPIEEKTLEERLKDILNKIVNGSGTAGLMFPELVAEARSLLDKK